MIRRKSVMVTMSMLCRRQTLMLGLVAIAMTHAGPAPGHELQLVTCESGPEFSTAILATPNDGGEFEGREQVQHRADERRRSPSLLVPIGTQNGVNFVLSFPGDADDFDQTLYLVMTSQGLGSVEPCNLRYAFLGYRSLPWKLARPVTNLSKTVVLNFQDPDCGQSPTKVDLHESGSHIGITLVVVPKPSQVESSSEAPACLTEANNRRVRVRLARPLGNRRIVDTGAWRPPTPAKP